MEPRTDVERKLQHEIGVLRHRLADAEEVLHAIQRDQVDAVVVYTSRGDQIFSLRPHEPEHPYRLFVEKMQEGTVVVAGNGTVIYSNQYFASLAGRPLESVMGCALCQFFEPDDRPALAELLSQDCDGRRGEFRMIDPRGGTFPVYVSANPYSTDGENGACLIITDRREQKRVEEMTERLQHSERLASIGTLATGIAHEINNPLNAILLTAQEALDSGRVLDSELEETLHTVITQTLRCGRIVKSVLQFARHENTRKAPHDLNAVLRHAGQIALTYAGARSPVLSFQLDPHLPRVMLNPVEIEQVAVNLIQNACEAGSECVRIHITSACRGHEAEFTIQDDGPGIEPGDVKRIFDPFFSKRRGRGGTGLGLSIVHGIVAQHQGAIEVTSDIGQGTCFHIRLPLASETVFARPSRTLSGPDGTGPDGPIQVVRSDASGVRSGVTG